ncbi:hypothetical protein SANTM175S_02301 [Streptomyces antimycoticus]
MPTPETSGLLAEQLLRLTRRLHRAQKRHMEPLGITPAQSRLLRTVSHSDQPPRMADLAQHLEVVPRAVTTLVDALEAHGSVRRVPDPSNRRVVRIELTDTGAGRRCARCARRAGPPRRTSWHRSGDQQRDALGDLRTPVSGRPCGCCGASAGRSCSWAATGMPRRRCGSRRCAARGCGR